MASTIVHACVLAGALAFTACAGGGATGGTPGGATPQARSVPGFDTRDYPGDAVMRAWLEQSPYRWVGYYLPAPCYTGTTWSGKRAPLREMGWGFAVLYVGEQDWSAMAGAGTDSTVVQNPRCTRANLTAQQAGANARSAADAAAADGFPQNTVIFLDVERVERVSPELESYVRAWMSAVLGHGRYVPGLYVHDANAPALYAIAEAEYLRAARTDTPPMWVAKSAGFALDQDVAASGHPVATIWQGSFDAREEWGGTTLRIDVNVARSADPSRGR